MLRGILNESQMGELYRACDCFVLPTRGEAFGLSLLEAMACGVPIITTRYSGHREIVSEENAIIVRR